MKEQVASPVSSVHNVVLLAGLLGVGLTGSIATSPSSSDAPSVQRTQSGSIASVAGQVGAAATQAAQQAIAVTPAGQAAKAVHDVLLPKPHQPFQTAADRYYAQVREQLNWMPIRFAGNMLQTPDAESRLLLTQSAAKRARLEEVGLSHRDVYGIINAETSWVPRQGASKDGTPNLGIAQFEPATARAMGLRDPADPVESVHMAALHLKDAAKWSARRIAGLKLTPEEHARKLREGVSIYYNLSVKGRNKWNGLNTAKLPVETQRHIANARIGARQAAELENQLRAVRDRMQGDRTMTASLGR